MGGLFATVGEEGEQSEDRLSVLKGDIGGFAAVAAVPAERRPAELLRCPVAEKEDKLKRFYESDVGRSAAAERASVRLEWSRARRRRV